VVGLTPQTTNERRANTMKTYLLRTPKTVEPQFSARRVPWLSPPSMHACFISPDTRPFFCADSIDQNGIEIMDVPRRFRCPPL
jgi:hypothetical protein